MWVLCYIKSWATRLLAQQVVQAEKEETKHQSSHYFPFVRWPVDSPQSTTVSQSCVVQNIKMIDWWEIRHRQTILRVSSWFRACIIRTDTHHSESIHQTHPISPAIDLRWSDFQHVTLYFLNSPCSQGRAHIRWYNDRLLKDFTFISSG